MVFSLLHTQFSYPLIQIPIVKEVPLHRVVVKADEFETFKNSKFLSTYDDQNKSLGYMLQVVVHSTIIFDKPKCLLDQETLSHILQSSVDIVSLINEFQSASGNSNGRTFNDLCFQVEDRVITKHEQTQNIRNVLPTFGCLLLSPSRLLENQDEFFANQQSSFFSRVRLAAFGNMRDLLFGLPWKLTGLSRYSVCTRKRNIVFAITLLFREYDSLFVSELGQYLKTNLNYLDWTSPNDTTKTAKSDANTNNYIFLVWYRNRSYISDYAPLIFIYVILLLYVYFSVRKLEMVKSKWGLALSACVTVAGSLFMSIGLCVSMGFMVPTLSGSEIFPYLVVLIGFENVIVLTKSVVATPIDLPVKYRIAEGLSKESWPLTKLYLTGILLLGLGFFTFHPTMQEFCLFAVIGLTMDFFLQLFFFVTILSVDIRRMELSDLYADSQKTSVLYLKSQIISSSHLMKSMESFKVSSTDVSNDPPTHSSPSVCFSFLSHPTAELVLNSIQSYWCRICAKSRMVKAKCLRIYTNVVCRIPCVPSRFRPSNLRWHKRKPSAAETAAYLASDDKAPQHFPKRIRFLRYWAKLRLFQRLMMISFTVWIFVFFFYTQQLHIYLIHLFAHIHCLIRNQTADISTNTTTIVLTDVPRLESLDVEDREALVSRLLAQLRPNFSDFMLNLNSFNGPSSPVPTDQSPNVDALIDQMAQQDQLLVALQPLLTIQPDTQWNSDKTFNSILRLVDVPLEMGQMLKLTHWFKWDTMLGWNYLAFYHWPLVAHYYNLTLTGSHIALLEPVHLRLKPWTASASFEQQDEVGPVGPSGFVERENMSTNFSDNIVSDDDNDPILHPIKQSSHFIMASPGGFASWTARLGLTVNLLRTSIAVCGFVLVITFLAMVCLQSRTPTPHNREPIIRVLPLTISLTDSNPLGDDLSVVQNPEWTIACGILPNDCNDHLRAKAVLAITCVRSFHQSMQCVNYSSVIRLWCLESGNSLGTLNRYSESTIHKRHTLSIKPYVGRFSTIWCMEFTSQGYLLAACSDGLIELWNCQSTLLIGLFSVSIPTKSPSCFDDADLPANLEDTGSVRSGGVTVLKVIDESRFLVGTSYGFIACFDMTQDNLMSSSQFVPTFKTRPHSRAVTQMAPVCFIPNLPSCSYQVGGDNDYNDDNDDDDHNDEADNRSKANLVFVSGSEDGLIVFSSLNSIQPIAVWNLDPTPVLSLTVSDLVVAASRASGSLYVTRIELSSITTDDRCNSRAPTLEIVERVYLDYGLSVQNPDHLTKRRRTTTSNPTVNKHVGSFELKLFRDDDDCKSPGGLSTCCQTLDHYRLVSHDFDGNISVWNLNNNKNKKNYNNDDQTSNSVLFIVRSFRTNVSPFNFSNSLLSIGGRAVFGDQGYLRVVNPWTAKYERSVQLLHPLYNSLKYSTTFTSSLNIIRKWSKELVPLGFVRNSGQQHPTDNWIPLLKLYRLDEQSNKAIFYVPQVKSKSRLVQTMSKTKTGGSYVISMADADQTLVVVPLSALNTD